MELRIADRQGIEIDYCPQCRGVWLDRGELDKIIERTVGLDPVKPDPTEARYASVKSKKRKNDDFDPDYDEYRQKTFGKKKYRKDHDRRKKRENPVKEFFEDIFDVF